mmetsp:Transcript_8278/g.27552  ORF Transcript_8278/g.27552 Transcript_8278/m.27552 type:complete len:260 (+) Transcript_8278:234-1013(+)
MRDSLSASAEDLRLLPGNAPSSEASLEEELSSESESDSSSSSSEASSSDSDVAGRFFCAGGSSESDSSSSSSDSSSSSSSSSSSLSSSLSLSPSSSSSSFASVYARAASAANFRVRASESLSSSVSVSVSSSNPSSSLSLMSTLVASMRPVKHTHAVLPLCLTSTREASLKHNPEPPIENCSFPPLARTLPSAMGDAELLDDTVTVMRSFGSTAGSSLDVQRATWVRTTMEPRDGVNARPEPGSMRNWNSSMYGIDEVI